VNGNRVLVVLNLLTESIRQPSEARHRHAHREVLAFNVAGRNVLGIGTASDNDFTASDALCWAVGRFAFPIRTIELDEHAPATVPGFSF
jgi:hypothetical protein